MDRISRAALTVILSLGLAVPVAAQSTGTWRDDLLALAYPPDTIGGYWDAGYDFDFRLHCSQTNRALNLGFGFVNVEPRTEYPSFFLQIGEQRYEIPWLDSSDQVGFVSGYYPAAPMPDPWPGQAELIQQLLDGHALVIMEGDGPDDPDATRWAAAEPAPGHPIFQALSRTCGSGVVTPQTMVAPSPPPAEAPSTWILGAGTEFWDGLTAFSRSDADHASGFLHCGRNGRAEFVLRVDAFDALAGTSFGAVIIGAEAHEIVATTLGRAYVFEAAPGLIAGMMRGRTMNIDSLIPTTTPIESMVTFPLAGASSIIRQALSPCAATALP